MAWVIMEPANYKAQAAALAFRTKAFIGGKAVGAKSGKTFATVNPATGATLAEVAECDAADVDLAVAVARRAFEAGHWSRMAPAERKKRLTVFADLIDRHAGELALLETLDMGKPIRDSLTVDLPNSATRLRFGPAFLRGWQDDRPRPLARTSPYERCRILDPAPSLRSAARALRRLKERLPAFIPGDPVQIWAGMIDVTPDELPVISTVAAMPGLVVATGFSGHGFGIGPAAGRLTADLVLARLPAVSPEAFRLDRFRQH